MRMRNKLAIAALSVSMFCLINSCGESESVTGGEKSNVTFIDFFKLNPLATYLHVCMNPMDPTYDDGAIDPEPILLSDYGINPGDSLVIEVIGEYLNGNEPREYVVAVFSTSGTLLDKSETHRVPGAVEAGEDYDTGTTYGCGGEPTDIPEDFFCTPKVYITVPVGATHLFLCPDDSYYEDLSLIHI